MLLIYVTRVDLRGLLCDTRSSIAVLDRTLHWCKIREKDFFVSFPALELEETLLGAEQPREG